MTHKRKVREYEEGIPGAEKPATDGMKFELKQFVIEVFAYLILQGSIMCLAFIGQKPAITHDGEPGHVSTIFLITLIQCFLMQHLTYELMLSHVTKQKYKPFSNRLNVAMAIVSLLFFFVWLMAPSFYTKYVKIQTVVTIVLILTMLC